MPRDKIISPANPRVKELVRLRDRRRRDASGSTVVDGRREVLRAMQAGVALKSLFLCPDLWDDPEGVETVRAIEKLLKTSVFADVRVHETTAAVFKKISYGERAEGVLAVCSPRPWDVHDLARGARGLYVVVEGVEKPGNLGAILRSCDGAGVDGLIVTEGLTDLYNPNVIRSSLGTVFTVKSAVSSNPAVYDVFKARKIRTCAAAPQARTLYTDADLSGPLAIILGSEQKGLRDFWTARADCLVKIPMKGKADSLNVSAAAAVLLYEALRQRHG